MLVALGESDCELIHGGLLVQPVNTLTSLAFIVVGAAVALRGRDDRTSTTIGYAALLIAVGAGSVAFHGPQLPGAQMLHDTSIHLLLGFVVLHRVGAGAAPVSRRALATVGAVSVLVAAAIPGSTAALTMLLAAVAVVVEVRWHALRSQPWRERWITGAFAAVLAVAGTCFILGRTGAPTCDPLGMLQFHGLWHVSAATAFGLWWLQLDSSAEGSEPTGDLLVAQQAVRSGRRRPDRVADAARAASSSAPVADPEPPSRASFVSLPEPSGAMASRRVGGAIVRSRRPVPTRS